MKNTLASFALLALASGSASAGVVFEMETTNHRVSGSAEVTEGARAWRQLEGHGTQQPGRFRE